MAQRDNSRALGSLGEENVEPDSQTQQRASPRRASSQRRRRRQATRESRVEDASRTFQGNLQERVYKYSSRAPPMSMGCNGGSSSGPAQIPALPDDGNIMGMMARSASYWARQGQPRCWIRGCACARSATPGEGHHARSHLLSHGLLDEGGSLTSLRREQLFSVAEDDDDGSLGGTWRASAWADPESDEETRRFAEEYSLVPWSQRKIYTAQTFHDAVERYIRGF